MRAVNALGPSLSGRGSDRTCPEDLLHDLSQSWRTHTGRARPFSPVRDSADVSLGHL